MISFILFPSIITLKGRHLPRGKWSLMLGIVRFSYFYSYSCTFDGIKRPGLYEWRIRVQLWETTHDWPRDIRWTQKFYNNYNQPCFSTFTETLIYDQFVFKTVLIFELFEFCGTNVVAGRRSSETESFLDKTAYSLIAEIFDLSALNTIAVDRAAEHVVFSSMNHLRNGIICQTQEINISNKMRCEADNVVATVEAGVHDAILSATDNLVHPRMESAILAAKASSTRNTRDSITGEAGSLSVSEKEFELQTHIHHTFVFKPCYRNALLFCAKFKLWKRFLPLKCAISDVFLLDVCQLRSH